MISIYVEEMSNHACITEILDALKEASVSATVSATSKTVSCKSSDAEACMDIIHNAGYTPIL